MAIENEIERPISTVFRRAYIKRRQSSDGLYESSWFEITELIKKWGNFQSSADDIRLNRFTFSGLSMVGQNDEGKFNDERSVDSLWHGYLTRHRTLVKIEAGYVQDDDTELPTTTTQGIYVLDGEVSLDAPQMQAVLNCRSLQSVFDEVRAGEISGIYTNQTASQIFEKIRDHTDGTGIFLFRQYITSTAWSIGSTTLGYVLSTSAAIQDLSVWDMMNKLAEAEGYIVTITRDGGLRFDVREPNTSTVVLQLKGQTQPRQNIISLNKYTEAVSKFYNYIRLRYGDDDTTTAFIISGSITSVDPSNPSWKYGNRIYEFENKFFADTATAQLSADNLRALIGVVKFELDLDCCFLPNVEISDRVGVTYHSYQLGSASLWDFGFWASDTAVLAEDGMNWDDETGEMFNFNQTQFRIIAKKTNLDTFVTSLSLREV